MDWHRRKVLVWHISNTLEAEFRFDALTEALHTFVTPDNMMPDQGSQLTSFARADRLRRSNPRISMGDKGHFHDNIFAERLRRSVHCGCAYLHALETGSEAQAGVREWMDVSNYKRPYSAFCGKPPAVVDSQRIETTNPTQHLQKQLRISALRHKRYRNNSLKFRQLEFSFV